MSEQFVVSPSGFGRFGRFVLAGGVAAAANYGSGFMLNFWLPYTWAIVIAYGIGMTVAFFLMRVFVFDATHRPMTSQAWKFAAVNAFALLQTVLVSLCFAKWVFAYLGEGRAEAAGHLIGVLFPIVTSYIGHRFATFR